MNLLSSRIVNLYIKWAVFTLCFFTNVSVKAWEIDLSRRQKDLEKMRKPASVPAATMAEPAKIETESPTFWKAIVPESFSDTMAAAGGAAREVVILHTDEGFVPDSITLRKGQKYKVHVVNISEKNPNISFILDAFSEHHSTYFAKHKVFELTPKTGGVFSFVSPETAKQGKFVILGEDENRKPASP